MSIYFQPDSLNTHTHTQTLKMVALGKRPDICVSKI